MGNKNANFVSHKKSKLKVDGKPQLPLASALVEGEIAINFAKDVETLSIKNESGDVVTFSSDNYYTEQKLGSGFTGENSAVTVTDVIDEVELVTSSALNDLEERKLDASAYTPTEELWVSGTGENAIVQKGGNNTASGKLSVAMGSGTTASGDYSVAEGLNTTASGYYSHAEGYGTSATSYSSHAEGWGTTASGDYSHAEGQNTTASGYYSHAEGSSTTASGVYSHAEGSSTTASGRSSHAEGSYAKAGGNYSHAEGYNTIASGQSSHAEGQNTTASDVSHAEGNDTIASGYNSHAEGSGTLASGSYSHAEGNNTKASGYTSHAEGSGTKAGGNYSHAEGLNATASGNSSHAEGNGTTARGDYSHAEGNNTIANNQSEHASGQYNVSASASTTFGNSGNTLFSVGNGTSTSARHNAFEIRQNGDIYIVSGGTNIKLQDNIGGSIEIDQVIDSGTSASTDAVSTSAVYGFVTSYTPSITVDQDFSNTASTNPISTKAVYSAVTDNELVWTNAYVTLSGVVSSHTENTEIHITSADRTKLDSITGAFGTMAYEDKASYSSATEVNTAFAGKANTATTYTKTEVDARDLWVSGTGTSSVAQKGGNNTASGDYSVAEGNNTKANGESSHAEGSGTIANGSSSHAEGGYTKANSYTSHAEGWGTTASGIYSHAEGHSTTASGDSSHAEGSNTTAGGNYSHAEGSYTKAGGSYSHAEGNSTSATSDYSHAEGNNTIASGNSSHAEGNNTKANGYASHAEGIYTTASGYYSHAEGYNTTAGGNSSHAEGNYTITLNDSEHASGQFNNSVSASTIFGNSGNTLFSVGNGTADNAKHNAFEIRQNGDIYITSGNSDIKLQDYIGSVETVTAITPSNSGSTEPIATKVIAENELVMANALNDLESRKLDASAYTTTSAVTSGSTDVITSGGVYAQMDGIKLKKITQSAYDALVQAGTVDTNTLYVITD